MSDFNYSLERENVSQKAIFQAMVDYFETDEWNYTENESDETIRVEVAGKNVDYSCVAAAREETRIFRFYSICPIRVPKTKRRSVAEFLTRANYGLSLGNFEMDWTDGEIRYKTSAYVGECDLYFSVIKQLINANLQIMDEYFPGLMKMIYGDVSAAEAIAEIENEDE